MEHEQLREAFRELRPEEDARSRMLETLLAENQARKPRKRHPVLLPAVCAAAVALLAVLSPLLRPAPVEELPPERPHTAVSAPRPPVQAAPPPQVAVTPPGTLTWEGRDYVLLPEDRPGPEDLGEQLAQSPEGTLFRLRDTDSLALLRQETLYRYAPVP